MTATKNTADPLAERRAAAQAKLDAELERLREHEANKPGPTPQQIKAGWMIGQTTYDSLDYLRAEIEHERPGNGTASGRYQLVRQGLQRAVRRAREQLVPNTIEVADAVAEVLVDEFRFETITSPVRVEYEHLDGSKPHILITQLHQAMPTRQRFGIEAEVTVTLVRGREHSVLDSEEVTKALEATGLRVAENVVPVITTTCPGGYADELALDIVLPMSPEAVDQYELAHDLIDGADDGIDF